MPRKQQVGARTGQREARRLVANQRQPTLDQPQRRLLAVGRRLGLCGVEVGLGGLGLLGAVQVLGAQHGVAAGIPARRDGVQVATL